MDYFSKFLRTTAQPQPTPEVDHSQEFHRIWVSVKETLLMPDERQLTKGIQSTNVPGQLQAMLDALVNESTRVEDGGTGACLEYLLKNDVLGTLVRLSETDRPAGIQAEVLRTVSNMVVLLDEQFLVHSAVHKAVLRLLRNCVGDDLQEQLDGRSKLMGAAGNAVRSQVSEYEKDLVNLLCILCSRIRTYRELLMIFFHDKHWYRSEPLFSVDEEDEEEDEEEEEDEDDEDGHEEEDPDDTLKAIKVSTGEELPTDEEGRPTGEQPQGKKPEYEFLLFNYLLRFVHREGHIGEFARAGLLFLMDVAMSPGEMESQGLGLNPGEDPVNDAALALAEYIVDGDFSDVLGAGLGAVYSMLPSKLGYFPIIPTSTSDQAMTIGSTGAVVDTERQKLLAEIEKNRDMGIEDARSPDFKAKVDHFLTLLLFLQDVLRRNVTRDDASAQVGNAIVRSILDAVRRIFLENVLYPTILECSDLDGSAVAVMSYIEVMVRTLRQGPLCDSLVEFLVSEDNDDSQLSTLQRGTAGARKSDEEQRKRHKRRQSSAMLLLEMEAPDSRKPTDYFTAMARFTLKDLILSNLNSTSSVAATTAMQLLTTMLTFHPLLTIERMLFVIPDSTATAFPHPALLQTTRSTLNNSTIIEEDDEEEFKYPGVDDDQELSHIFGHSDTPQFVQPLISFSTHEREMGLYLALISRVDSSFRGDNFSTGYDHYLHDALLTIQAQPVYLEVLEDDSKAEPASRYKHRLNISDPILSTILRSLTTFFGNSPDFNISLTAVLGTLAIHPDRSLAGWLTFATNDDLPFSTNSAYDDATFDGDGDDRSLDFGIERRLASDSASLPAASLNSATRPAVYTILQDLVNQLERYRQSVENFDKYLLERRQGLLFSENLSDALNLAIDLTEEPKQAKSIPEPVQKAKSKPRQSAASTLVSFLSPRKTKPTKPSPSDTSPPAKRADDSKVDASPFGNHYQQTSSIEVEPYAATLPSVTPTPAHAKGWSPDEDDVFGSAWGDKAESVKTLPTEEKTAPVVAPISLSQLLDNVVILEESIKELVAIIHARRSLGIDTLRYF